MRIDFHTHPLLIREILEKDPQQLKATWDIFKIRNNPQPLKTFFLEMDISGIDKAVLLPIDCSTSRKCQISSNEIVYNLCKENDRFIGFASVDPLQKDAKVKLINAVKNLGLKGLKLAPELQEFSPKDRTIAYPLYETAQDLEIPVIFHCGMSWEPGVKLKYANPLLLEDIAFDFPDLNIVIAHFAWPWVLEAVTLALKYPNIYIDTSALYFDSPPEFLSYVMTKQVPLSLIERSLRRQIIFGSNYPRVEIKNMVQAIQSLGLTDGCLKLIMGENAQRILKL